MRKLALTVVHVAAASLACYATRDAGATIEWLPLVWLAGGILVGQVLLLAFWIGMGRGHFLWRLPAAVVSTQLLVGLTMLWPPGGQVTHMDPWAAFWQKTLDFQGMLLLFAVGLLPIRRWIARLATVRDAASLPPPSSHYTLFQLLLLTSVIALLFGLRRAAGGLEAGPNTVRTVFLYGFTFAAWWVILVMAAWACLGRGWTGARVTLVLLTAATLGFLLGGWTTGLRFGWYFAASTTLLTLAPTLVAIITFLVLRRWNYRLLPRHLEESWSEESTLPC